MVLSQLLVTFLWREKSPAGGKEGIEARRPPTNGTNPRQRTKKHALTPPNARDESMLTDHASWCHPHSARPCPRTDPLPLFPPRRGIAADVAAPRSRTVFHPLLPGPLPAWTALSVRRRRGTPVRSLRRYRSILCGFSKKVKENVTEAACSWD